MKHYTKDSAVKYFYLLKSTYVSGEPSKEDIQEEKMYGF